ncbi:MAG TPA: alkaline phosphatase family protein, partial [Candidatus Nitrosopolaris sp.]|nr:alkaline phosphatase family protein [Candidatus Nitrosopolaris sp.]
MDDLEREHSLVGRALALALGLGAAYAAFGYEAHMNSRTPAVLHVPAPRSMYRRGPAARVVWVLVDGLRLDASRQMTVLNRLRAEGEDISARAEFPTFSGPNFVAQASGIEPAASGVLTNGYPGEVPLDSVFRRAKLAGLRTAVLTTDPDQGMSETYASWTDEARVVDPELHLPAAHLVFAHLGYVDAAAHASGAASPAYRAAVARADDAIGRIARTLDPERETLVVTSDHGNLDQGGHGGSEREALRIPIVIWGAGAEPRRRAGARGRDVAPTIASLLGIGPLSHATGRPLVLDDASAAQQRAEARATVGALSTLRVDYVPVEIPIAVVGLLMLAARSRLGLRPLLTSPTYALAFSGLLFATHTLSFSVSNAATPFGARVLALSTLAGLAQLRLGGRSSLVPAALVMSLAALGAAVAAAHQPLAPADGTVRFLPLPAFSGLAFACFMVAAMGRRGRTRMRSSSVQAEAKPALEIPVGMLREPDLVTTPEVAQLERPRYTA